MNRAFPSLMACAAFLASDTAAAGTLTTTQGGSVLRWTEPTIVFHPTTTELRAAAERAAETWNRALDDRLAPRLMVGSTADVTKPVRSDHFNLLTIQTQRWCPPHVENTHDCYDENRNAITHLFPVEAPNSPHDGEISESDVELNGVHHTWDGPRLLAVVTHEFGHVLGLEHSCGHVPRSGRTVPCTDPTARESIMYPAPLEQGRPITLKPSADDLATLTTLYPLRPSHGCSKCEVARRNSSSPVLSIAVGALGLLILLQARRR